MIEEAGFIIADMLFYPDELVRYVVPIILAKHLGVFGVERLGHIQAVEPHLIRINFLMPKSAFASPWMVLKLRAEQVGGLFVFCLARDAIKHQYSGTHADLIKIVVRD